MNTTSIISHAKIVKMFEAEESGQYDMQFVKEAEVEGLLYSVYLDRITGKRYAVRKIRCVNMGFNSNAPGKEDEFASIMDREGACKASWGVTGRTMHQILAHKLAEKFPQYRFEIGYNYECTAYNDHRMVTMPGFEPEIEM